MSIYELTGLFLSQKFIHKITVNLSALGTPAVTYGDCKTAAGNIEFQIKERFLTFLDEAFYGIFLIIVLIIIRIYFGFILKLDLFCLEVIKDLLLYGIRQTVLKIEQRFLTQIRDLVMLGVADRADRYKTRIDKLRQRLVNVEHGSIAMVKNKAGELGVGQSIFVDTVQHVQYDHFIEEKSVHSMLPSEYFLRILQLQEKDNVILENVDCPASREKQKISMESMLSIFDFYAFHVVLNGYKNYLRTYDHCDRMNA